MPSQEAMRAPSSDPQAPVPPHEKICAPSVDSPDDLPSEKIEGVDTPILSIFDVSSDSTDSSCLSMMRADSLDEQLGGEPNSEGPNGPTLAPASSSDHNPEDSYDADTGIEEGGSNFGRDAEDQTDAASNASELPNDDGEAIGERHGPSIYEFVDANPDADEEWLLFCYMDAFPNDSAVQQQQNRTAADGSLNERCNDAVSGEDDMGSRPREQRDAFIEEQTPDSFDEELHPV